MSTSPDSPAPRYTVEAQAAHWLVQHDRGFTPAQQDEFLQWLAADPDHRESFNRHRAMWSDFNQLAQWQPEHSVEPNPDLLARPRRRYRVWTLAPLAAAAAIALVWLTWSSLVIKAPEAPLAYETESYRQVRLPDGTIVDLNGGAHLLVQFSVGERRVLLVEGEAQFSVTKDPTRPFVVRAGGVDVRAIGTAFNVKLAGANVEVLVTEGTVHLAQNATASVASRDHRTVLPKEKLFIAELTAGQHTVVPVAAVITAPPVTTASPEEIARLLDWQPRLLDFTSTPLIDVVAEFNRRNVTQIILADDALHGVPIVASIRSDNVDGFVRLLEATVEVSAERPGASAIILRPRR